MTDSPTADLQLWRVALGMQQRDVWADGPFDAAHKCGLGSGDLLRAEAEVIRGNDEYPTGTRASFHD